VVYPNLVHIYCQIGRISELGSDINKLSEMPKPAFEKESFYINMEVIEL